MYEQERQRAAHLLILLCYTILTIVLTGESLLLGWETEAIVLLLLGVVVCWTVHFTEKFPVDINNQTTAGIPPKIKYSLKFC